MEILDGRFVANKIKQELKNKISQMPVKPGLAVICVGENPASQIYVRLKHKMCDELGINMKEHFFQENVTQNELESLIDSLNTDTNVHGILVQSPVPYHINIMELFARIAPEKDVDGFHPVNVGRLAQGKNQCAPCTPLGIMTLLKEYQIEIEGKKCVVIGRSIIVGRPMAQLLLNANGTVTVCHSRTKNLASVSKEADILIVAVGKPKFITEDMVKEGAVVVDVGINRKPNSKEIVGDVDFEKVKEKCSYITPVPGGVGPMTIIMLMNNVIERCRKIENDKGQE